ncbi:MFS general substrate transporter [Microthyrium microscopicum]|uniref:MFS general substrate transporter n=1 Tax=Microthyrium microscopicum TaxID=703497 RepID=A0A6A6UHA8_9PEZI|nr:MFS general substrate transporter [Microthyrium microscopicum]
MRASQEDEEARQPLNGDRDDYGDANFEEDDAPLLPDSDVLVEQLRNELEHDLMGADLYERQSKIINRAIQDIGMGKYQWELFILCGFGWFADNLTFFQGLSLSLPSLQTEFGLSETSVRYTTMILYVGMGFGSVAWGFLSDTLGRRITFNTTLFITGFFGVLISFGPTWATTALLFALMGFGVGGNLPVDGALFLEFLPMADNKLLTLLSAWWPFGQLTAAIIAWYFIPRYSCAANLSPCFATGGQQPCCESKDNRGWRYFIAVLGLFTLFMFVCRFFLFNLLESPKYLLSRNRQSEAIEVVQRIARYNGGKTWLDEKTLHQLAGEDSALPGLNMSKKTGKFSVDKVGALFDGWKLGITTALIWVIWLTVGWAYPLFNAFLPQYLEHNGKAGDLNPTDVVYTNFLITAVAGVPGSFIAAYTVDQPRFGRKGTMAISTLVTGFSLFLFTLSGYPPWQTFAACIQSLFSNVMYGVIYAYTPEVFPAPVRGTGSGIASLLNRLAGLSAPMIAAQTGKINPSAPILAAGGLYLVSFVAMCLLPIETRGMQSL